MTEHYRIGKYLRNAPMIEVCRECMSIRIEDEWHKYDRELPYHCLDKIVYYLCCECHNGGEE